MSPLAERVRPVNDRPLAADGAYVLYWMTATRRTRYNAALERAVAHCRAFGRPLLVMEGLRAGHRWASRRVARVVIDGMQDNAADFAAANVTYFPYVEPSDGDGRGLLAALAEPACVVVTDHFPGYFHHRMVDAAGAKLSVRLEAVDSCGILPLSASPRIFTTAASFRRHVQKTVAPYLAEMPAREPLGKNLDGATLPAGVGRRWPAVDPDVDIDALRPAPDPVADFRGGSQAALAALDDFLATSLDRYHEDRNQVDDSSASALSPYLHFGQIAAHEIVARVIAHEDWTDERLPPKATGSRAGWWGMSPGAEAFLDQVITWRELGHVFCHHRPEDHDRFESLPDWARATLDDHRDDEREHVYTLDELREAATHDPVWNAAQRELLREGRMHNYLRMNWGKRILEWSATPEDALESMTELNNRYALDGRDPNSSSGIAWTLGRFDRAWGPERLIFGKVRYMTSASTKRKLRLKEYLERYGP